MIPILCTPELYHQICDLLQIPLFERDNVQSMQINLDGGLPVTYKVVKTAVMTPASDSSYLINDEQKLDQYIILQKDGRFFVSPNHPDVHGNIVGGVSCESLIVNKTAVMKNSDSGLGVDHVKAV